MNNSNNVLSAFSYLSILVAPLLVPIIIYFVSAEKDVKYHAKRALLSHLIPTVLGLLFVIGFFFITITEPTGDFVFAVTIAAMIFYGLMYVVLLIWNIIQAVKVLR